MAYHEISLTVVKTLWYFDFEYPLGAREAGRDDIEETSISCTIFRLPTMMVQF